MPPDRDPHSPVHESYDQLAGEYDSRWRKYVDATMNLTLEGVDFSPASKVADVACGTGELERRLLQRCPGCELFGVDLSSQMLKQARDKRLPAEFLRGDAARLPFPEGHFDGLISANAFHYFRHPQEVLVEWRRVLKPDGKLILVDWCDDYLSCKLCSLWLRWTDPAFHRTYSLQECEHMLTQAGFKIQQATRRKIDWLWGLMRFDAEKN